MVIWQKKANICILLFLLWAGCIEPADQTSPPLQTPEITTISDEDGGNSSISESPSDTNSNNIATNIFSYELVDSQNRLTLQSIDDPEVSLVYDKNDFCLMSYCILGIENSSSETFSFPIVVKTNEYSLLFKTDYVIKNKREITLYLTKLKSNSICFFYYPSKDQQLMKEFSKSFDFVCSHRKNLEEIVGLPVKEGYVLIWENDIFHAGEYWGNNILWLSKQADFGMTTTILHELVHSQTEALNLPTWFNEGIAEYYSYKLTKSPFNETEYVDGLEEWNYSPTSWTEATYYYDSAHSAVIHFVEKYGEDKLRDALKYFNENPLPSLEDKPGKNMGQFMDKMREITGDGNFSSAKHLFE